MTQSVSLEVKQFKGLRNDENSKNIAADYLYKVKNYNFPDTGVLGLEKILMPSRSLQVGTASIDGMFEYKYLDNVNVLRTEYIVVTNGCIYKTDLSTDAGTVLLKNGLTAGKCSFAIYNDKLYIANGKNNVQVYDGNLATTYTTNWLANGWTQASLDLAILLSDVSYVRELGAAYAYPGTGAGTVASTETYYSIVFVTAGGDEYVGAVSNYVSPQDAAHTIELSLPIGYSGTTQRKIYRSRHLGGGVWTTERMATIANNTTLTWTDTALAGGVTEATTTNNALPKPYFLTSSFQKLVGGVIDAYPTQIAVSGTNVEVWDAAENIDISNYGSDNTSIKGIGNDFNKVIVGTEKHMYLVDVSDTTATVSLSRANVGIKNGYTVKTIPAFGDFSGGMMFVSSLNDVRLMSGMQAIAVATSLDNVRTENWAQVIRGSLDTQLLSLTNAYAEFYKNKYHLVVNGTKFVFDIRTQGWTEHEIKSTTYTSTPIVLSVMNNLLYNGQSNGWIEKEYASITYRSESVEAYIQTPHIAVNSKYKFIEKIELWFIPSASNVVQVNIVTDDNNEYDTDLTFSVLAKTKFTILGGAYNQDNFSANYFDVDLSGMDYRVINVNKNCRWIQMTLTNTTGNISFQGFRVIGQELANKETLREAE